MTQPMSRAITPARNSHPDVFALTGRCTHFIAGAFSLPFDIHSLR